jgi:hypothetical protein
MTHLRVSQTVWVNPFAPLPFRILCVATQNESWIHFGESLEIEMKVVANPSFLDTSKAAAPNSGFFLN